MSRASAGEPVTGPLNLLRRLALPVLLGLVLPSAACGQSDHPFEPRDADGSVRVLLIGNSLTFWNEMPAMLARLLEDGGLDDVTVESIALPNYGLQDHWPDPVVQNTIADGWDVVALQQGPSATEGRPSLLEYSQRFADPIRAAGGMPALYMVWPAEARSFDFPGVSDSYSDAADLVGGLLFPAGEAWLDAWELDESLELYGGDRFHPSPLGSYLAALVMYEQLGSGDARELDGPIPGYEDAASPAELELLRRAAHQANEDHRRTPR